VAKHTATPIPGRPMVRNRRMVPADPSRQSMKPMRNRAAKNDRQAMIVQGSPTSSPRAMAPPKLQTSAAPNTSRTPMRASATPDGGDLGATAETAVSGPIENP
jgi:hypothetical protein